MHDGDVFEFDGFQLEAHHVPGHSGGHFVYFEPDSRTLFAGDQLLPHVSPNPLLEPSLDDPDRAPPVARGLSRDSRSDAARWTQRSPIRVTAIR